MLLELQKNKIRNLKADMFKGLDNLRDLSLYANEVSSLEVGAFHGLGNPMGNPHPMGNPP